ncbi:hypothetical protein ACSNOI_19425 [Actinomadura kijaniata]|uniref:hypothetical protein n=1 Tax=Actinomadura kijaniata TaxID=46161 RepID=UPI003F1CBFAE
MRSRGDACEHGQTTEPAVVPPEVIGVEIAGGFLAQLPARDRDRARVIAWTCTPLA